MRHLAAADVRTWRARRWYLTEPAPDVASAASALPPLPASPTAYVSLFARMPGFRAEALDRMVFEDRSLRPYPMWRRGARLVPVENVSILEATHLFRARAGARRSKVWKRREGAYDAAAPAAAEFLAVNPRTAEQLADSGACQRAGVPTVARLRDLLDEMAARGDALRTFAGTSLNSAQPAYASPAHADYIPPAPAQTYEFLVDLALDYFRTAGPATRDDFVWWASISYASARHSIEDLAGLLEEVDIDGERKAHFMHEEDAADLRSSRRPRSARAALLPADDPSGVATERGFDVLGGLDLDEGLSSPSRRVRARPVKTTRPLVAGGRIAGSWGWDPHDQRATARIAGELGPEEMAEVEAALEGLGDFLPQALSTTGTRHLTW